jgi:hypothetical protein
MEMAALLVQDSSRQPATPGPRTDSAKRDASTFGTDLFAGTFIAGCFQTYEPHHCKLLFNYTIAKFEVRNPRPTKGHLGTAFQAALIMWGHSLDLSLLSRELGLSWLISAPKFSGDVV